MSLALINFMLFVDTSFLIALLAHRDDAHSRAHEFLQQQNYRLQGITSNLILTELLTFFSRRDDLKTALRFQEGLFSEQSLELIWVDKELHEAGSKIMQKYQEHHLSFVDAVSFAIMKQNKLHEALSFDRDFVWAGFKCFP